MIIESRKNQTIVKSRGLLAEKKFREKENLIAVEGAKLCSEAIDAGLNPEYGIISEEAEKKFPECVQKIKSRCTVYTVTNEIYLYMSSQKSPQGIFLAIKLLDKSEKIDRIVVKEKILLLDRIQDSGNLGTMIRTSEAFGIDGIILSEECADPFSPKTLRASMGSAFRMPIAVCPLKEAVTKLKENGVTLYAAMLDETAERLGEFVFPKKTALVIGNEGQGVRREIAEQCRKVYIPITGAESLNAAAAAAVICYEMGRSR